MLKELKCAYKKAKTLEADWKSLEDVVEAINMCQNGLLKKAYKVLPICNNSHIPNLILKEDYQNEVASIIYEKRFLMPYLIERYSHLRQGIRAKGKKRFFRLFFGFCQLSSMGDFLLKNIKSRPYSHDNSHCI